MILVVKQRYSNFMYFHCTIKSTDTAKKAHKNELLEMYVSSVIENHYREHSLSFSVFSTLSLLQCILHTFRRRMKCSVPIDHTSNGCRSCVANVSDQTKEKDSKEKLMSKRPV